MSINYYATSGAAGHVEGKGRYAQVAVRFEVAMLALINERVKRNGTSFAEEVRVLVGLGLQEAAWKAAYDEFVREAPE